MINEKEFLGCVDEYGKLIFSIALSFTRNYFDAEDMTQETFVSAYAGIGSFDGKNMKAWLTTICANKCKDFLRRSKPTDCIDDTEISDTSHSPEFMLEKATDEQYVRSLCDRLQPPYREVAVSYFCQGEKLSVFAKKTNCNLRTMQTRLYRAKKQLAKLWREENR